MASAGSEYVVFFMGGNPIVVSQYADFSGGDVNAETLKAVRERRPQEPLSFGNWVNSAVSDLSLGLLHVHPAWMAEQSSIPPSDVVARILYLRGHRVLLDSDLAVLYGVPVKRLNEAVRRNVDRFPSDFCFLLTKHELMNLKSQIATSSSGHGGTRKPPTAFSEHGAIMVATILNSRRAVEMSIYVVRAFVKAREMVQQHSELARELNALKKSVATLDADTRRQFDQVYEAILGLMSPGVRRQ
jgi:hypothetical protein